MCAKKGTYSSCDHANQRASGEEVQSTRACRHQKNEPEEELAAVGLAAPAEEGAKVRKQHGGGSCRQGALRRDPPARPFTRLAQACCKINTRMLQKRDMQEQWHVLVAVASGSMGGESANCGRSGHG